MCGSLCLYPHPSVAIDVSGSSQPSWFNPSHLFNPSATLRFVLSPGDLNLLRCLIGAMSISVMIEGLMVVTDWIRLYIHITLGLWDILFKEMLTWCQLTDGVI